MSEVANPLGRLTGKRRRRLIFAVGGVAVVVAAAAGVWWWSRAAPPRPPEIALAGADPDVASAVTEARGRVLREPQSADAWGTLGEVLLANGFYAEADVCLARAETLDAAEPRWPFLRAWNLLGRDRKAGLAALRRAVERTDRAPTADAEPYLLLAEVYMQQDDRDQAEALCRRALEREPDSARARLDLGMIAYNHDDMDGCLSPLLRAADNAAVRHVACTQLAAAYRRKGKEAEAADFDRKAQEAPTDVPWPEPYLAELQSKTVGRETRCRAVKQLESQRRWKEAADQLRVMTAADPSDQRAFSDLGSALMSMGQLGDAENAFRSAAALSPQAADPAYDLAVVLFTEGEQLRRAGDASAADKFRASADAARQAIALKADHAQAHLFLGLALQKLNQRPQAIESFHTAERCRPESANIHLALGEALAEDGRTDEAVLQLQRACDLAPNDPRPREALERIHKEHP
jgi:tetratricopeptide (TPR) repeat protein